MRLSRQDGRLAIRTLLKHPGFTTVAVLSLALAIALNTTMYSVIDALVNPRLDIRDPVMVYSLTFWGDYRHRLPPTAIEDALRSGLHGYEAITGSQGYRGFNPIVEHGQRFHDGTVRLVRPDFFTVLGVHPLAGRVFGPADVSVGAHPALIGERLAAELFPDGSPIGQSIRIDDNTYGVIGILGRASDLPNSHTDVWILPTPDQVSAVPLNIVRLRRGAPMTAIQAELNVLASRLATAGAESDARFDLKPVKHPEFAYHRFHFALIGAVVAVLLVACSNLANMQLVRGMGRARELALRVALGASRGNVIAHLLLESAVLAAAGLAIGLLLTFWGIHALSAAIPPSVGAYVVEPQASWRVLAVAVAASVACVVLIGLVPAIHVSRVDPNDLLKSAAGTGAHKRNQRRSGALVVAQIGLALVLLSGAAIVFRQAWRVERVRFGYDPRALAQARQFFRIPQGSSLNYATFAANLVLRLRAMPEVADAAVAIGRDPAGHAVTITDPGGGVVEIPAGLWSYEVVSPSYLRTFRLPIVKGRDFLEGERDVPAVIVDQFTARSLWPNSSAVGSMIKLGEFQSTRPWARVVGVVGQQLDFSTVDRSAAAAFRPSRLGSVYVLATVADTIRANRYAFVVTVVARARTAPERLPLSLRRALRNLPGTVMLVTERMEDAYGYGRARASHDFVAAIFSGFAILAIALAALGIYGIVAHSVAERRREMGVRIALGASGRSILNTVLREGNVLALSGIALGLLLTKYGAGWLDAFSMEDDRYDAVLFATMAAVLFAVTVIAAFIPALRATRIDPVEALRTE